MHSKNGIALLLRRRQHPRCLLFFFSFSAAFARHAFEHEQLSAPAGQPLLPQPIHSRSEDPGQSSLCILDAGTTNSSIATQALPGRRQFKPHQRPSSSVDNFVGGIADAAKRLARTAQGGLPIVGLLSRLAAPGGGVGWDELAYPEFARALVDADASGEASYSSPSSTAGQPSLRPRAPTPTRCSSGRGATGR